MLTSAKQDAYARAIHYLALQPSICHESIDLVCYLWSKDGKTVLHDIDNARKGREVKD